MSEVCNTVGDILETSLERIERLLSDDYGISRRSVGLLALQEDEEIISLVKSKDAQTFIQIQEIIKLTKSHFNEPLSYIISQRRQEEASLIVSKTVEHLPKGVH